VFHGPSVSEHGCFEHQVADVLGLCGCELDVHGFEVFFHVLGRDGSMLTVNNFTTRVKYFISGGLYVGVTGYI